MEKYLKRKAPSSPQKDNDLDDLPWDPVDRKRISDYHPNQRDEVIRKYRIRGPYQPRGHVFEQKSIGNKLRRFNPDWFDQYSDWLEYSVKKEKAESFFCYLFRDSSGKSIKSDVFITEGFSSWNKFRKSFSEHVGGVNSFHNNVAMKCENLMKQGHFQNMWEVSSKIHKDIVHCFAEELVKSIIEEMDHDVFGFLVDESADVSGKEQMAVVFQFVDKNGIVKERSISIMHVAETSSATLKSAIDSLFAKYGLSIKKVRGRGYDGVSNMKAEFKGLKSLISKENTSAYYVHCFAH